MQGAAMCGPALPDSAEVTGGSISSDVPHIEKLDDHEEGDILPGWQGG